MAALSLTPEDILAENGLMEEPNCLPWEGRERKNSPQRYQRGRRGSEDEEKGTGARQEVKRGEKRLTQRAQGTQRREEKREPRAESEVTVSQMDCATIPPLRAANNAALRSG